jgi:hypothetical protein
MWFSTKVVSGVLAPTEAAKKTGMKTGMKNARVMRNHAAILTTRSVSNDASSISLGFHLFGIKGSGG